jgi:hypothetical protein
MSTQEGTQEITSHDDTGATVGVEEAEETAQALAGLKVNRCVYFFYRFYAIDCWH